MAKQINKKVSRKRKSTTNNTSPHRNRQIVKVCGKVLNEMYLSFSSGHAGIRRHGMDQLSMLLKNHDSRKTPGFRSKGSDDLSIAKSALLADLDETHRDWQYMTVVFTEENGETQVHIESGSVSDITLPETTPIMPQLTERLIDEATEDNSVLKGWAWFVAPSFHTHFAGSEDFLLNMLVEEHNILDEERCSEVQEIHAAKYINSVAV